MRITGIGLTPLIPMRNPVINTANQTALTLFSSFVSNTVLEIIADAYGAVIADENPAANSPSASPIAAPFPTLTSKS